MAYSRAQASTALLICLNLLLFTMVSSYNVPCPPPPKKPSVPAPSSNANTCPLNILKLDVCASLLNGLLPIVIGTQQAPCCTLIAGLVDLDAAICLCTALKANVLGINLNVPISLSLLLNRCAKKVPSGFQCPQ